MVNLIEIEVIILVMKSEIPVLNKNVSLLERDFEQKLSLKIAFEFVLLCFLGSDSKLNI